ncbi:MAG: heme exporter protein CcmD [Pseudomonadota bacterium]
MDKLLTVEFWQMGGYALYVWGSYGAALLVFVWNLLAPYLKQRELLSRETRDQRS